ncbi:class I SAM-dependent methyltransferase [Bacillus sp. CGMCC 1.16541]|uniref:class I SAM-dependent DNA methyltransferase n=1 Tax=Bacillus sp. CGMCC 1.16541 TaxID=2185143 RepID=UPI000D72A329|nr:class I SAM-dependent methyltransferase [Bacillus sp. CGMCC 1.16541]
MSASYGHFAYVYDRLMSDVPYEQWVHYFKQQMFKANVESPKVLDLACGTGEVAVRLAKEGLDVVGVDLSDDMLMVAKEKAAAEHVSLSLYQQNMSELDLGMQFDCVVIFCDSLNYLQSADEVKQTIHKVYEHLKPGGMLLFDVHSVYKMTTIFGDNTFSHIDEDVSYIWNCFSAEDYVVEHELTFFVYDEEIEAYQRFDELHKQQTFTIDTYTKWLQEAGFRDMKITADFEAMDPVHDSERIFFSVYK